MLVEPTANAAALQLVVKPPRKAFVAVVVGDEAAVKVDRLPQQRGQILDQLLRQADAAQEDERQTAGTLQGADVDRAGTMVNNRVQVLAVT